MTNDRTALLHEVQKTSFAVTDAVLYLDTHPECKAALAYFDNARAENEKAVSEYERYYGALTVDSVDTSDGIWTWSDEPMPWQIC